jgi:carbamoylphosphate synthase large subunit
LDEAKEFHYIYENSLLPAEKRWKLSVEEQWKQSFIAVVGEDGKEKSVIEIEMEKRKISRYHAIDEINRKISQNFANSLHSRTKMIMMRLEKK